MLVRGLVVAIFSITQISSNAFPKSGKVHRSNINLGASAPLRVNNRLSPINEARSTQIRRNRIPVVILNTDTIDFDKLDNLNKPNEEQNGKENKDLGNLEVKPIKEYLSNILGTEQVELADGKTFDWDKFFKFHSYNDQNRNKKKPNNQEVPTIIDLDDYLNNNLKKKQKKLENQEVLSVDLDNVKNTYFDNKHKREKKKRDNKQFKSADLNEYFNIIKLNKDQRTLPFSIIKKTIDWDTLFKFREHEERESNKSGNQDVQFITLDKNLNNEFNKKQNRKAKKKLYHPEVKAADFDNYVKLKIKDELNRRQKKKLGNGEVSSMELNGYLYNKSKKGKTNISYQDEQPLYLDDYLNKHFNEDQNRKDKKADSLDGQSDDIASYLKNKFNEKDMIQKKDQLSKVFDKNGMVYITKPKNNEDNQLNYLMYKVAKYGKDNVRNSALRQPLTEVFSPEQIDRLKKIARAIETEDGPDEQPKLKTHFDFSELVV